MKTINGLPIFELLFDNALYEETLKMSLVDCPAVEINFTAFANAKPMAFTVQDEDKHIIEGVAMRPNFPIYRCDPEFGEYYVVFSKETIATIASEFLKNRRFNLNHDVDTEGLEVIQSYLIDRENGICPEKFSEMEDGTWILDIKVNNESVWAEVKEGKFKGFSVESFFTYSFDFSKINNSKKINQKMSKLHIIKAQLAKLLLKFGTVNANDAEGNLIVMEYEGEELTDGMEVYHTTEEGELKPVEDGIYTIDEKTYEVKDGVIFAKEVSEEEKPAEPKEEEPIVEIKEEQEEEEKTEEEEEKPAEEEEKKEDGVDYAAELESLKATLTDITGAIENAVQLLNGLTERIMVLEEDMARLRGFNPKIFAVEKPQPKPEKKTERNFDVFSYMKK